MAADVIFLQPIRPQGNDNTEAIASVCAQEDRVLSISLSFGPRNRVLLTAREAVAMARALVDAVKALDNNH